MAYTIEFAETAKKQIKKLSRQEQSRILDYLEHKIAPLENPRLFGKGLKANLSGLWRYRVEDYRIICQITDSTLTILVLKAGHRKDIYE